MKGLRVLNTRPIHQSARLNQAILDAGGIPVGFPALAIHATELNWLSELPDLATIDQAVFTSANAVQYFFAAVKAWPATINVIAVGSATAAALQQHGIQVHHVPDIADSEHLLALDCLQSVHKQTILLIKGRDGRPLIAETLTSRGARIIPVPVYQRDLPAVSQEVIDSLWQDTAVDIILFTSEQAMHNLFALLPEEGRSWLRNMPCLVIGNRLADAASALGIKTILTCQHDKIMDALNDFNKE